MFKHRKTSLKGFEPPTHGLEGRCSIQLSYRLMKAGDGNRTHVISLEGWSSTIELHPLTVGVTGFEPATSWSQIKRSSQAEPHPVSALLFLYFLNSKIYYIESSFKCQQLFSTFFIFICRCCSHFWGLHPAFSVSLWCLPQRRVI